MDIEIIDVPDINGYVNELYTIYSYAYFSYVSKHEH